MENEPTLFAMIGPDLGVDNIGPRCIHTWTYNKTLVDNLPELIRPYVREAVKKVLRDRGVHI